MKTLAIITSGLTGIVNISIEIANRLKNEGFQLVYLSPLDVSSKVSHIVSDFILLPPLPLNNSNVLETYAIYKNKLESVKADCFIIDVELHELIFTVYGLSTPIRLISPWFPGEKGVKYPPLTSSIIPTSKKAVEKIWFNRWSKTQLKKILKPYNIEVTRRKALKKLAEKNGFPIQSLKDSSFPPVFLNRHLKTYCCNLKSLDFPNNNLPSNYQFIGPQISESRVNFNSEKIENQKIESLIAQIKKTDKKLIYCSLSTFQKGDVQFLKRIIKACELEKNWILITSLGGLLDKSDFTHIPENVFLFNWIPQLYVLSQADLSINHGGINTINECILYEVPMLVYSGNNYDQNGCMARVHYHEIGLQGNKELDDVDTIKQKINTVLENQKFKERLIDMSQTIKTLKNKSITNLIELEK